MLTLALKAVVVVGSVCAAFGPGYSFTAVHLLYGGRYSGTEMPRVLAWYSAYILFMAVNGVSEAFLHASSSVRQLHVVNVVLAVATGAYLAFVVALAGHLGVRALITLDPGLIRAVVGAVRPRRAARTHA